MCTTSGAVCGGGYKRMLERKKRYTEPAGMKEWSDGGQNDSCTRNGFGLSTLGGANLLFPTLCGFSFIARTWDGIALRDSLLWSIHLVQFDLSVVRTMKLIPEFFFAVIFYTRTIPYL